MAPLAGPAGWRCIRIDEVCWGPRRGRNSKGSLWNELAARYVPDAASSRASPSAPPHGDTQRGALLLLTFLCLLWWRPVTLAAAHRRCTLKPFLTPLMGEIGLPLAIPIWIGISFKPFGQDQLSLRPALRSGETVATASVVPALCRPLISESRMFRVPVFPARRGSMWLVPKCLSIRSKSSASSKEKRRNSLDCDHHLALTGEK